MTKRQMIDAILQLNTSADVGFLAGFRDEDLNDYLRHLRLARTPRLQGDPHRYDRYFTTTQTDRTVAELPPCPTDEELDKLLDETMDFEDEGDENAPPNPDSEDDYEPVTGRSSHRNSNRDHWLF